MRCVVLTVFVCLRLWGQSSPTAVFEKAPGDVETKLRDRVTKFFQAHVDGKFRAAEQVVAEDSKDAFYNTEKRQYLSFEIASIQYSDNFTKATVITNVELDWVTPRLGKIRVKPPLKSLWKVENGDWYYYLVPQKDWDTPWGRMKPGPDPEKQMASRMPSPQALYEQVRLSRAEIKLKSAESSKDSAEIVNSMPGEISLRIENPNPVPGLNISVDRATLKAGEIAKVTFDYNPPDRTPKRSLQVEVRVNPTGQLFTFNLTFAVPPELEKWTKQPAKQ